MARMELNQSGIIFNEEEHRYFREDGKELSGITALLQRQLFPTEYEGIPRRILDAAAEYGKDVHKSCELFDSRWENDGTTEVQDYIDICKANSLVHEASEYLVTDNENYASACDKVYRTGDDTFSIGDIKTYYGKLSGEKLEKCRWQLSIYAYLFEQQNKKSKVDRLFVIHLRNKMKSDGTFDHVSEIINVERIPSDICKELLEADLEGRQFVNPLSIPEEFTAKLVRLKELVLTKNQAEEEISQLKQDVMSTMEILDVTSWVTDEIRLTRKLPSTRSSFDLKLFKSEHPDIDFDRYMKTSNIAGSLMIAV